MEKEKHIKVYRSLLTPAENLLKSIKRFYIFNKGCTIQKDIICVMNNVRGYVRQKCNGVDFLYVINSNFFI